MQPINNSKNENQDLPDPTGTNKPVLRKTPSDSLFPDPLSPFWPQSFALTMAGNVFWNPAPGAGSSAPAYSKFCPMVRTYRHGAQTFAFAEISLLGIKSARLHLQVR